MYARLSRNAAAEGDVAIAVAAAWSADVHAVQALWWERARDAGGGPFEPFLAMGATISGAASGAVTSPANLLGDMGGKGATDGVVPPAADVGRDDPAVASLRAAQTPHAANLPPRSRCMPAASSRPRAAGCWPRSTRTPPCSSPAGSRPWTTSARSPLPPAWCRRARRGRRPSPPGSPDGLRTTCSSTWRTSPSTAAWWPAGSRRPASSPTPSSSSSSPRPRTSRPTCCRCPLPSGTASSSARICAAPPSATCCPRRSDPPAGGRRRPPRRPRGHARRARRRRVRPVRPPALCVRRRGGLGVAARAGRRPPRVHPPRRGPPRRASGPTRAPRPGPGARAGARTRACPAGRPRRRRRRLRPSRSPNPSLPRRSSSRPRPSPSPPNRSYSPRRPDPCPPLRSRRGCSLYRSPCPYRGPSPNRASCPLRNPCPYRGACDPL